MASVVAGVVAAPSLAGVVLVAPVASVDVLEVSVDGVAGVEAGSAAGVVVEDASLGVLLVSPPPPPEQAPRRPVIRTVEARSMTLFLFNRAILFPSM